MAFFAQSTTLMFGFRTIPMLVIAAMLPACATPLPERCATGEQRVVSDLVYFGTGRAKGVVTQAEWDDFLRVEVTPRFAQGFSVWQASGQWRAADGSIVREASYVLSLVHPDDAASDTAIGEVRERYRIRFEQESTMRVRQAACVSF
jgi:hypothetical protein